MNRLPLFTCLVILLFVLLFLCSILFGLTQGDLQKGAPAIFIGFIGCIVMIIFMLILRKPKV